MNADDTQQPHSLNQPETADGSKHETHVGALVFLVLLTLVVGFTALSMARPQSQETPPTPTTVAEQNDSMDTQSASGLDTVMRTFPQGLPAPQPAQIISASQTENNDFAQSIIRFETDQSLETLYARYNDWAEDSGFQITDNNQNGTNAALSLGNAESQLFITMADLTDHRRVEINQVRM